jgi:hypothetical protein
LGRNRIINLKAVFRKNILRAATSCADTCQYATLQAGQILPSWRGHGVFSPAGARFINGSRDPVVIPQGLKPLVFKALFGTTEVVP